MKYFMDTHDRTKGSSPGEELTEEQFFAQFDALTGADMRSASVARAARS